MGWRLVITDAELVRADLDLLERLDAEAEEYCQGGGVIHTVDAPHMHGRMLFGPGEPPAFLLSDSYPTLELVPE